MTGRHGTGLRWGLRVVLALAGVATSLLLTGTARAGSAAPTVRTDRALANEILSAVNETRSDHSRRALRPSRFLARAATSHALSMGRSGFFSHTSADGSSAEHRISSYYRVASWNRWAVGEVLLWAQGNVSPGEAVAVWLASPAHRRELLKRTWKEIGVAVVTVRNAPGIFRARDVTIVVVDFGLRS